MLLAMKRSRAPNFTVLEIKNLLSLIKKYPVIDNKKTDGATIKEKHDAWQTLTFEYNSLTNCSSRTPENLLACYKNYKKKVKKSRLSDKMIIRAPSQMHAIEEHGQDWSTTTEATNQSISDQIAFNQANEEIKIEVCCTEESPPESPSNSGDPVQLKALISPSLDGDEEFIKNEKHMRIQSVELSLDLQQIQNDKTPDFAKNIQNQDIQQVHLIKREIDPSLESEKKGIIKKVTPFQELADVKKHSLRARKKLLDLQIQHQELEISLTQEKLDFEKKKNKIELDFLQQKHEIELNYLRNKRKD